MPPLQEQPYTEAEPLVTVEAGRMIPAIIIPNVLFFAKSHNPALAEHFPNAFNLFAHAGNIGISECVGLGVGYVAGKLSEYFSEDTGRSFQRRTRKVVVAAAFAAGLAINTITETKWGQRILPNPNTLDSFDTVYGTAASTLAAGFGIQVENTEGSTDDRNT